MLSRLLFVFSAFGLVVFRSKHLFENPQFFLEDGTLFFVDWYNEGWLSIFHSYAGYLVVYQRLAALASGFVPMGHMPLSYLLFGSLVTFMFFWELSGDLFPQPWGYVLAVAFAFAPFEGTDLLTLTNSQWVLGLWLMLFVCGERFGQQSSPKTVALFLLTSFTGPFLLFLSPLIFCRVYRERERFSRDWFILFLAALLIQLGFAQGLLAPRVPGQFELVQREWVEALGMLLNFPLYRFLGGDGAFTRAGGIAIFSLLIYAGAFWIAIRRIDFRSQYLLAAATLFVVAALMAYRSDPSYLLFRPRYAILPTMGFGAAFLSLSAESKQSCYSLFAVLIFLSGLLQFSTPALEDFRWQDRSACIGGEKNCSIPLNWPGKKVEYQAAPARAGSKGAGRLRDISNT